MNQGDVNLLTNVELKFKSELFQIHTLSISFLTVAYTKVNFAKYVMFK